MILDPLMLGVADMVDEGLRLGLDPIPINLAPETAKALSEYLRSRVDLSMTFDLRWKADMRAIKRWQEAHPGNDLVWPDRADMVVWLLDQMDAMKQEGNDAVLSR